MTGYQGTLLDARFTPIPPQRPVHQVQVLPAVAVEAFSFPFAPAFFSFGILCDLYDSLSCTDESCTNQPILYWGNQR